MQPAKPGATTAWGSSRRRQYALELNAVDITGGDISGVNISGQTITGGTIRTAASGTRVVITGGESDRITWYDAYTSSWQSQYGDATSSALNIVGPERRSSAITTGCSIALICDSSKPNVRIRANDAVVTVGSAAGTVRIDGDLNVYGGRINPGTNFDSGTSNDGVWIQEGSASSGATVSRRWKLYYDTVNHRLFVRNSSANYAFFTPDGKSY